MDEVVEEFVTEARESLEALDTDLVRFERQPGDPELLGRIFRIVHTVKGTSGFLGLMRLQTVAHSAENVLGGFRDGTVAVDEESVSAVLQSVDVIRSLMEALASDGKEPPGDDGPLIARLDRACVVAEAGGPAGQVAGQISGQAAARSLIEQIGGDSTVDAACEGLHAELSCDPQMAGKLAPIDVDIFQAAVREALCDTARARVAAGALTRALSLHDLGGARSRSVAWLRASLIALEAAPGAVDQVLQTAGEGDPAPAVAPPPPVSDPVTASARHETASQTIRVGVDTLEHLMTVASELVLIRNQLVQTLREQPESPFAAPLHRLNQVTSELQESVMTTRMQPISGAWAKLPRIVRDLANELGKEIELVMLGQDTELDRQVLELVKDPLTHMIRNAADHGLETPQERAAAGKSRTGRITLQARHEGGAILIEVADDGRGLSAAKIRSKVVASGLATASAAEAMSDAEVRQFIFAAGFSTASAVTAVSGRGVGMDVVRTNIEQIGGAVELTSVEGRGTRFVIRIPLTLTIVSALIVESGGQRFAMPQSSVVELVGLSGASAKSIEYVGGAAVLRLRDRLLPLVSLQSMLGMAESTLKRDGCIIVAKLGGFSFGVIVDRVFDTEEIVVKPVSKILRHLKVYSGATILGDGAVIMILDFKGMAAETGAYHAGAPESDATGPASEPTTPLLIFRSIGGALQAAPLAEVNRIEEISAHQLESVGGRSVVQYRGRLTPVVTGADAAVARDIDGRKPMLVFSRDDRLVGLLVEEIVDIVEVVLKPGLKAHAPGSLGSLIVAGAATELIDVDVCWRRALGEPLAPPQPQPFPQSFPQSQSQSQLPPHTPAAALEPFVETTSAGRRLLVVDRSPFCRLLLQPLLAQAAYEVTVATDADAALALHDRGQDFDLILVDTNMSGAPARSFVSTFAQATRWHGVPLLGLGMHHGGAREDFDSQPVLDALTTALQEPRIAA